MSANYEFNKDFNGWLNNFQDTGQINPLRLGMTTAELQELFGFPHDLRHGGTTRLYGAYQFHFQEDKLVLIYFATPDGVIETCIKQWGFEDMSAFRR